MLRIRDELTIDQAAVNATRTGSAHFIARRIVIAEDRRVSGTDLLIIGDHVEHAATPSTLKVSRRQPLERAGKSQAAGPNAQPAAKGPEAP